MMMKFARNLSLAVTIIAICLTTTATQAQRSSGPLVLRFRAPFPFTVKNTTFAAGEYEVTQPGNFILVFRNLKSQASAFEHFQPADSRKELDRRSKVVFHRYGGIYFLAAMSDGSLPSTYDLDRSNKEQELVNNNPTRPVEVVSVLSGGAVVTTDIGPKQ
jgi:hypothetical protein